MSTSANATEVPMNSDTHMTADEMAALKGFTSKVKASPDELKKKPIKGFLENLSLTLLAFLFNYFDLELIISEEDREKTFRNKVTEQMNKITERKLKGEKLGHLFKKHTFEEFYPLHQAAIDKARETFVATYRDTPKYHVSAMQVMLVAKFIELQSSHESDVLAAAMSSAVEGIDLSLDFEDEPDVDVLPQVEPVVKNNVVQIETRRAPKKVQQRNTSNERILYLVENSAALFHEKHFLLPNCMKQGSTLSVETLVALRGRVYSLKSKFMHEKGRADAERLACDIGTPEHMHWNGYYQGLYNHVGRLGKVMGALTLVIEEGYECDPRDTSLHVNWHEGNRLIDQIDRNDRFLSYLSPCRTKSLDDLKDLAAKAKAGNTKASSDKVDAKASAPVADTASKNKPSELVALKKRLTAELREMGIEKSIITKMVKKAKVGDTPRDLMIKWGVGKLQHQWRTEGVEEGTVSEIVSDMLNLFDISEEEMLANVQASIVAAEEKRRSDKQAAAEKRATNEAEKRRRAAAKAAAEKAAAAKKKKKKQQGKG